MSKIIISSKQLKTNIKGLKNEGSKNPDTEYLKRFEENYGSIVKINLCNGGIHIHTVDENNATKTIEINGYHGSDTARIFGINAANTVMQRSRNPEYSKFMTSDAMQYASTVKKKLEERL